MTTTLKLLQAGWILTGTGALLTYPIAHRLTSGARKVWLVDRFSEEKVKENQELYELDPGFFESVPKIYGIPVGGQPVEVVVPAERVLRPKEEPTLEIVLFDASQGDKPWETKTYDFVAENVVRGSALAALFLFVTWAALRTKRADRS